MHQFIVIVVVYIIAVVDCCCYFSEEIGRRMDNIRKEMASAERSTRELNERVLSFRQQKVVCLYCMILLCLLFHNLFVV